MSELTAQQELYLEYFFNDPECGRDSVKAAIKAGYAPEYHSTLSRKLKDEILSRTQEELALAAPKASKKLVDMMDEDGSTPKAEIRLKAVESTLDRIGVAKKQDLGIQVESKSPIFFIPNKAEVDAGSSLSITTTEE